MEQNQESIEQLSGTQEQYEALQKITELTEELETVEASKAADKASDAIEEAAKGFMTLVPQVKSRMAAMASKSGKGLARVMTAAIEFPYAESYPTFKNQDETTLFMMVLQLNELKAAVSESLKDQMAEIRAEVVNKTTNEIIDKEIQKGGQ